jgi:hypothetical protein
VYPAIVARQQLGKNVTAATNTHATIEELLDTPFSTRFMLYQKKVGGWFFPELLVLISGFFYKFFWFMLHYHKIMLVCQAFYKFVFLFA